MAAVQDDQCQLLSDNLCNHACDFRCSLLPTNGYLHLTDSSRSLGYFVISRRGASVKKSSTRREAERHLNRTSSSDCRSLLFFDFWVVFYSSAPEMTAVDDTRHPSKLSEFSRSSLRVAHDPLSSYFPQQAFADRQCCLVTWLPSGMFPLFFHFAPSVPAINLCIQ